MFSCGQLSDQLTLLDATLRSWKSGTGRDVVPASTFAEDAPARTSSSRPQPAWRASPVGRDFCPRPKARTVPRPRARQSFSFCAAAISHIDTWDMKPDAPAEYRGEFRPIATSAPGVTLCEHLPLLAKQAHHIALVNSINGTVNTNDHHAGYYHNLTGHVPDPTFLSLGNNRTPFADDWPYMGCVVAAKRPQRNGMPNAVTLPWKPSQAPYTRPGQFAGRLGVQYDPLYVLGDRKQPDAVPGAGPGAVE